MKRSIEALCLLYLSQLHSCNSNLQQNRSCIHDLQQCKCRSPETSEEAGGSAESEGGELRDVEKERWEFGSDQLSSVCSKAWQG